MIKFGPPWISVEEQLSSARLKMPKYLMRRIEKRFDQVRGAWDELSPDERRVLRDKAERWANEVVVVHTCKHELAPYVRLLHKCKKCGTLISATRKLPEHEQPPKTLSITTLCSKYRTTPGRVNRLASEGLLVKEGLRNYTMESIQLCYEQGLFDASWDHQWQ